MDKQAVIKKLTNLAQLDIDAVHAYEQALDHIDHNTIKQTISRFRDDHVRHIDDLSRLIIQYGGKPPERTKDFKGYLIEGFTSLRSITGTEGALKAMQTNEKLTNKTYEAALKNGVDAEAKVLIQKNYEDERRHLDYIVRALQERVWEN